MPVHDAQLISSHVWGERTCLGFESIANIKLSCDPLSVRGSASGHLLLT